MTAKLATKARKIKWAQIRDQSYLLMYKHWKQICELTEQHADREIVEGVNGRPLELWSPIFVLAELFEANGCVDLQKTVTELALKQVEAMLEQFRDSPEGQIIRAMKDMLVDNDMREKSYGFQELTPFIARQATFAEMGVDETGEEVELKIRKPRWLTPNYLNRKLRLLGFTKFKGSGSGRSFTLSREKLVDIWERYMGTWTEQEVQSGLYEFGVPEDLDNQPHSIVTLTGDDESDDSARAEINKELLLQKVGNIWTNRGSINQRMQDIGIKSDEFDDMFKQLISEGEIMAKGNTPVLYKTTQITKTEQEDEKDDMEKEDKKTDE
jgi:hypothetical protein